MIQTVDFFPPMLDDPYLYGQIAAANSLSDIYAMGASPTLAMNLICVPNCLSKQTIEGILTGGHDKVKEAGAIIAGGHTIEDEEPKYGLCVTGFADKKDILPNSTAKEGDVLILTKPLGTGILSTANKAGITSKQDYEDMAKIMSTLNRYAFEGMRAAGGANACTDVTGFGMLGHTFEMAKGSDKTIRLFSDKMPIVKSAIEFAKMGILPEGVYNNYNFLKNHIKAEGIKREIIDILCDPQTSGGLLFSVPEHKAQKLLDELSGRTLCSAVVGEVVSKKNSFIEIL